MADVEDLERQNAALAKRVQKLEAQLRHLKKRMACHTEVLTLLSEKIDEICPKGAVQGDEKAKTKHV